MTQKSNAQNGNRVCVAILALACMPLVRPAAAQAPVAAPGMIAGVVHDSSGASISGAQIDVLGATPVRATTGASGEFLLRGLPAGAARVIARRIGFRADTANVTVIAGGALRHDFVLRPIAQMLPIVAVKSSTRHDPSDGRLSGFDSRVSRGTGRYITREQIESRSNTNLVDALRRMPGVRVMTLRGNAGRSVALNGARCNPTVFIDGFAATAGVVDLDMFDLANAYGIEVYAGGMSIPPELLPPQGSENCGVIAIWGRPTKIVQTSGQKAEAENVAELVAQGAVLTAQQVDFQAQYRAGTAEPVYPPDLLRAGKAGRAVMEFVVDATGRVELGSIGVVATTDSAFATAARTALGEARFIPATVGNRPVRQLVQAPFDFSPKGSSP